MTKNELDLNRSLTRLGEIEIALSSDNLDLAEGIKLYQEAEKIITHSLEYLKKIKLRVQKIHPVR